MHSKSSEPSKLKQYQSRTAPLAGRLFTCARPGRSLGRKVSSISDEVVAAWVAGLPQSDQLHIVSLLGTKPNGLSEYSYYSFRGGHESSVQHSNSATFQEWLNERFGLGRFVVVDFPTIDTEPIEPTVLTDICRTVTSLLAASADVLLVDSGGEGRTGKVGATLHMTPFAVPSRNRLTPDSWPKT